MGIIIKSDSLMTTIQDIGRIGSQASGIPVSGAMDLYSARLANILIGNCQNEPVLEMLMTGPDIEFTDSCAIALTGADFQPCINGMEIDMCRALYVKKGDLLSFKGQRNGNYCYAAFSGRLDIQPVLGSCSTYVKAGLGGFKGRKLLRGDAIAFKEHTAKLNNMRIRMAQPIKTEKRQQLRVILGPQDDYFSKEAIDTFLRCEYKITNEFDRMGVRLNGEKIDTISGSDIISDGIALGSVQIPNHGQPIIMLADRQTAGGYTKIAAVIRSDIRRLAQTAVGSTVYFKKISLEQAAKTYIEDERELAELERYIGSQKALRKFIVEVNDKTLEITLDEK